MSVHHWLISHLQYPCVFLWVVCACLWEPSCPLSWKAISSQIIELVPLRTPCGDRGWEITVCAHMCVKHRGPRKCLFIFFLKRPSEWNNNRVSIRGLSVCICDSLSQIRQDFHLFSLRSLCCSSVPWHQRSLNASLNPFHLQRQRFLSSHSSCTSHMICYDAT